MRFGRKWVQTIILLSATAVAACNATAQDNAALLDMLVKRKLLTEKDADQVRTSMAEETETTSASKIKLSTPVKEMDIYGEYRLRYFHNDAKVVTTGDTGAQDRLRYRLRLGADIKLGDNFLIGFLLEANNSAHSANVTLGNSASTQPDSQVFNKATISTGTAVTGVTTGTVITGINPATGKPIKGTVVTGVKTGSVVTAVNFQDTVFFGEAYGKYSPVEWATIYAGKIPNPFITTRMLWDPDVYPEGFAEQFKFTLGPWGTGKPAPAQRAGGDGKMIAASSSSSEGVTVDVFANFGQFIYENSVQNTFNSSTGVQTPGHSDLWMMGWQVGANAHFTKNISLQVAPAIYNYVGKGNIFSTPFNGDGPQVVLDNNAKLALVTFNTIGVNDLLVYDSPVEFDWKMWGLPFNLTGDFAINLDGAARARNAGHAGKGDEDIAYQVGAGVGQNKKAGDFQLLGFYEYRGQYAIDPNVTDDDIFDGRLNMEGFYLQASYNFTDYFSLIVQGSHSRRIDQSIGTAGSGALGEPAGLPLQYANHMYVDFSLKF